MFKQHKEKSEVEEEDKAKAAKLFRKAAEQGHEYAKEWLEKNAKDKSE